jgi:hypothetical protein
MEANVIKVLFMAYSTPWFNVKYTEEKGRVSKLSYSST